MSAATMNPPLENLSILTPYEEGRYQWRVCQEPGCNQVFRCPTQGIERDRCDIHHRYIDHRESRPSRLENLKTRWQPFVILHDPLPLEEGGFRPGAPFDALDIALMLQGGCLPVGLTAEYHGETWTVIEDGVIVDGKGRRYVGTHKGLRRVK